MIFLKLMKAIFSKQSSKYALAFLLLLYSGSLHIAYIQDNWSLWTTTYWFIVTITTVGYGDLSPSTQLSQGWTMFVILGGCGSLLTALEATVEFFILWSNRKMKGLLNFRDHTNHVILMVGDDVQTIKELVDHVFNDTNREPKPVLLVSDVIDEWHDQRVSFVKGPLASDDVIERSGLKNADRILIWGADQEVTLAALAVSSVNSTAHIVVRLNHIDNIKHVKRINPDIAIVGSVGRTLAIQELQDHGIGEVIEDRLDNGGEATPYAILNPNSLRLDIILDRLGCVDPEARLLSIQKHGKKTFFPEPGDIPQIVYIIAKERPTLNLEREMKTDV